MLYKKAVIYRYKNRALLLKFYRFKYTETGEEGRIRVCELCSYYSRSDFSCSIYMNYGITNAHLKCCRDYGVWESSYYYVAKEDNTIQREGADIS